MNFFIELIKSGTGTSSKRFISLYSLALITVVIVADVFFKFDVNDIIYYILATLIVGSSSLTLLRKTDGKEQNSVID